MKVIENGQDNTYVGQVFQADKNVLIMMSKLFAHFIPKMKDQR